MGAPRIPGARIAAQAAELGLDPAEARAYVESGAWVRELWDALRATVEPERPGADLIAATEVRVDLSLAPDAMTDRGWQDDHPIIHVEFGLGAWANELGRTVTPFLTSADDSRPVTIDAAGKVEWATPDIDRAAIARRIAYSMSWLTSRARHPYERREQVLSAAQEDFGRWLGMGAVLFAVAHEMGHISAGEIRREPDPAASRAAEYRADAWALERVIALAARDPRWALDRTLPAMALYFLANAFRAAFANVEPGPDSTHPPPHERLTALMPRLQQLPDRQAGPVGHIALLISELLPLVHDLSSDQLAPPGELRRALDEAGIDVPRELVASDAVLSWRTTYSFATQAYLLLLAETRPGSLAPEDLRPIEAWLDRVPGPVLDTLGAASDGSLVPISDPSHEPLRRIATQIRDRSSDPYVREAIKD